MRASWSVSGAEFPFLFGGTFIEGRHSRNLRGVQLDFPSFSEGLSLRVQVGSLATHSIRFPFLFGGTFIEGRLQSARQLRHKPFPFLFGGTFIEGGGVISTAVSAFGNFPSFSEGLSLRACLGLSVRAGMCRISLPFRRDFH